MQSFEIASHALYTVYIYFNKVYINFIFYIPVNFFTLILSYTGRFNNQFIIIVIKKKNFKSFSDIIIIWTCILSVYYGDFQKCKCVNMIEGDRRKGNSCFVF